MQINFRTRRAMKFFFKRLQTTNYCVAIQGPVKTLLIGTIFFIVGCVETVNQSLPNAVSLMSGEQRIIISAPRGFCVDQRLASKVKGVTTLFVIDCVNVKSSNGTLTKRRPISAVLTATVVDFENSNVKSISRLQELLVKKPGINFLSRTNTNTLLKVHKIENKKEKLFFLIEQRGSDIDVKQSNYFWRVFFFIDSKLVSLTASNFTDGYESQKKLKRLIAEFANSTVASNTSDI